MAKNLVKNSVKNDEAEQRTWLELAFRTANKNYRLLVGYFIGIIGMASPLLPILPANYRWGPAALGGLILLGSIAYHGQLAYRTNRLRDSGIGGIRKPGYFRLAPYQDSDREKFHREDLYHQQIFTWLQEASDSILFLSGNSGTGKSSLLNAYVLPCLREAEPGWRTLVVRGYQDPVETLNRELRKPGQIWKNPPQDPLVLSDLLARAVSQLKPQRIFLVFEQFEEFLTLYGRSPKRFAAVEEFLGSLHESIPGVTALLVLREDRKGALASLQKQKLLPPMRQEANWKMLPSFTEQAARDFLAGSGLDIPSAAMENIFRHIAEIEGTPGEVRPITVNIVGLILERTAVSAERRVPRGTGGELVREYVRRCLSRAELPEQTPRVLERMITERGDAEPKSLAQLVKETKISETIVLQCLTTLYGAGLVRRIDDEDNIWEVSHDFVARILIDVLPSLRTSWSQRLRSVLPKRKPWYTRYDKEQIRQVLPNGQFCLHLAASQNDIMAVEYFLDQGADKEARDGNRRTPLFVAVDDNHVAVVRLLLEQGADVGARDQFERTSLHRSAHGGYFEIADLLLQNHADIHCRDRDGETPLYVAAFSGEIAVATLLLDKGADVRAADKAGNTPLHAAASNGQRDIAALLLDRNAELDAKNKSGDTPLHTAARRGHEAVVDLLLKRGADTQIRDKYGDTPLHDASGAGHAEIADLLLGAGADIQARKSYGGTPLHLAAQSGQRNVTALLLDRGADVQATDQFGSAALHEAVKKGHRDVTELLLARGADLQAKNQSDETALHEAAKNGHRDVVALLLDRGADIQAIDRYGRTASHFAAQKGHVNVVALLSDRGDEVDLKDSAGNTALHFVAIEGHRDLVAQLLKRGADINVKEDRGKTPLSFAAANGRREVVASLLEAGADINVKDNDGDTATHLAARYGHEAVLALLLERGADLRTVNNVGNTPLHDAADKGFYDIATDMTRKGAVLDARNNEGKTPLDLVKDPVGADLLRGAVR